MRTVAMLSRHAVHEEIWDTHGALIRCQLTHEGRAQAQALADRAMELCGLHQLSLHPVIDTSPCLSSYQTASIVAESLSRSTRRPFRIDQYDALGAISNSSPRSDTPALAAAHLRAAVVDLSRKSRASKLKLFIGHDCVLHLAGEELGLTDRALLRSLAFIHGEPTVLEWSTRGAFRAFAPDALTACAPEASNR